ncbi:hypothetical protein Anapl_00540 [Anas platyrhynchos]|uniref:Uncharacterized protein n=1 Tax=Anas platyrhynchos TaxID=8839 RepID=R0LW12_ANAPL|nr:hypothetical protein Anapl_00540 [Anas platyrhynchos]
MALQGGSDLFEPSLSRAAPQPVARLQKAVEILGIQLCTEQPLPGDGSVRHPRGTQTPKLRACNLARASAKGKDPSSAWDCSARLGSSLAAPQHRVSAAPVLLVIQGISLVGPSPAASPEPQALSSSCPGGQKGPGSGMEPQGNDAPVPLGLSRQPSPATARPGHWEGIPHPSGKRQVGVLQICARPRVHAEPRRCACKGRAPTGATGWERDYPCGVGQPRHPEMKLSRAAPVGSDRACASVAAVRSVPARQRGGPVDVHVRGCARGLCARLRVFTLTRIALGISECSGYSVGPHGAARTQQSQEELEDKFACAPRWLPGRDEISTEKKQREREGWRNLVSGCTRKLLRAVIVRNTVRGAWSSADPTWSKLNPKLRPALMCGVGAPRAVGVWDRGLVEGHRTSCGAQEHGQVKLVQGFLLCWAFVEGNEKSPGRCHPRVLCPWAIAASSQMATAAPLEVAAFRQQDHTEGATVGTCEEGEAGLTLTIGVHITKGQPAWSFWGLISGQVEETGSLPSTMSQALEHPPHWHQQQCAKPRAKPLLCLGTSGFLVLPPTPQHRSGSSPPPANICWRPPEHHARVSEPQS